MSKVSSLQKSMKIVEFKAFPNKQAIEQINLNIQACRYVWNECLAIKLEEYEQYKRSQHPYPVPRGLTLKPRFTLKGNRVPGKYTGSGVIRKTPKGKPCAPRCSLRTVRPHLENSDYSTRLNTKGKPVTVFWSPEKNGKRSQLLNSVPSFEYWRNHPRHQNDKTALHHICLFGDNDDPVYDLFRRNDISSRFLVATHQEFNKSWMAFRDANRPNTKCPKFKSVRHNAKTLMNSSSPVLVERSGMSENGYVLFPLGRGQKLKVKIKGLFERLTGEYSKVALTVKASGYYVQFCVPGNAVPLKPNTKAVGIDPGVRSVLALSNGRQYKPNQRLATLQKRLKRYQRKMSRQKQGSGSWQRTKVLVAKLHEKIARSRNAYNHKISTRLVDEFGAIAFENTKLQNMTRKVKPKEDPNNPGQFLPNGAAAKSGLNRAILNVSIGDLGAKTETKAKAAGRSFVKVEAPYTSQTCNACGAVDADSRNGKRFTCTICGHSDDADTNAAKNILSKSGFF